MIPLIYLLFAFLCPLILPLVAHCQSLYFLKERMKEMCLQRGLDLDILVSKLKIDLLKTIIQFKFAILM